MGAADSSLILEYFDMRDGKIQDCLELGGPETPTKQEICLPTHV